MNEKLFEKIIELNIENIEKVDTERAIEIIKSADLDIDAIIKRFQKLPKKSEWEFVGIDDEQNIIEVIQSFLNRTDRCWVIVDNSNIPIGLFGIWTMPTVCKNLYEYLTYVVDIDIEENPILKNNRKWHGETVKDIALLGFSNNNVTLVRDTLTLVKQLIDEYDFVSWTVHKDNTLVKNMYDRYIGKLKGMSATNYKHTQYFLAKDFDLSKFQEKADKTGYDDWHYLGNVDSDD